MTVARLDNMIATQGKSADLCDALRALVINYRTIAGFEGSVMLRDCEQAEHILFIERWPDIPGHIASRDLLDKNVLAAVTALLATPPTGSYREYVPIDPPV